MTSPCVHLSVTSEVMLSMRRWAISAGDVIRESSPDNGHRNLRKSAKKEMLIYRFVYFVEKKHTTLGLKFHSTVQNIVISPHRRYIF